MATKAITKPAGYGWWTAWRQLAHMRATCWLAGTVNTSLPGQNGRHFADDIFKHIFLNENVRISIKISQEFVPKGPIENKSALV